MALHPTASFPTPAELALALLVLKSKPVESSLEDYIYSLRRCICPGGRTPRGRLDSCAFWRQAYEKSEVAHSDLLNKHHELEQQIEQLRGDLRQSRADHAQAGLKRKRSVNQATKQSTNCKPTSADADTGGTQRLGRGLEGTNADLDSNDDLGGSALARNLIALRRLLSARRLDSNALAKSLSRTCAAADVSLSEPIRAISLGSAKVAKAKEVGEATLAGLIKTSRALRLCYPSLLRAVERLSTQESTHQCSVYAVVQLFQEILGHLHDIAALAAARTLDGCGSLKQNKTRTVKQQPMATLDFGEICRSLAKLAMCFFESLDLALPSHNKILEGLICVFLDHLGSSLSLSIFADVESPASKSAHLGLLPPCGLLDTFGVDQETAICTVQHEARYLVTILRQVMLIIDKQQSLILSNSVSLLSLRKSLTISNNTFATKIRNKLQHTLLRGVFGDNDESFKEAIRRPDTKIVDDDVDVTCNGREEVGEWFVGEVWALVGWDSLLG
ncbi:hypothetical protein EPUS_08285 [Endocarpon pusillum Z07020]|uniref:Uncharacterized protein n=1 Tax=Endocarpon pusillum (strain Z07020 / HMAS-L-300199) TaxID=1263415 RepID=U1GM64_ENDPU|nr:uncharacterized protein EPUS_08285 [Endocarpon pusillum Z07020]ERF73343.1 hypothetical protein EPUS_08285 [Endocarpon pusillum Z07020]